MLESYSHWAGCNLFHKPIKLSFPVLIIKGEESHYYIEPSKILEKELLKAGNKVKLVNIPKVNHFLVRMVKLLKVLQLMAVGMIR